jgi:Cytochrome c554 and c-prime
MFMKYLLILFFIFWPLTAFPEYKTLDDLAKAYSDESCKACHASIYEEWQSSRHAHSVVNSVGITSQFIHDLLKDWKKPLNKENLMRCMDCHAPQLKDASESLAKEVAELIVAAAEGKDDAKKREAEKLLSKLNVNCIICHNMKVAIEKNLKGEPKPGVYYGISGRPSPAHGTEKSTAIQSSLFCGQCHMFYSPPDREIIFCSSLYESYQDAYRGRGGTETCQDCHMKTKNRGHRIPGGHQVEMVKEGIGIDVEAVGVKLLPGKWIPTAVVNVSLMNQAGHRIPDG